MEEDLFKVFINDLTRGKRKELLTEVGSAFLGIEDDELKFQGPVKVSGEVYIVSNELILHFTAIQTETELPCKFCNEPVVQVVEIKPFYHAVPLDEIKSGTFDYSEIVRENLVVEIPFLVECHEGNCPERSEMAVYLASSEESKSYEGQTPFANLTEE